MACVFIENSASDHINKSIFGLGTVNPISISLPKIEPIDVYSAIISLTPTASTEEEPLNYISKLSRCINIDRILLDDKELQLVRPVSALVTLETNQYVIENDDLGIFALNQNLEEAIKEFKEDISFLQKEYGEESDERLTADARELKRKILSYTGKQ